MRIFLVCLGMVLWWPAAAAAGECDEWRRLDEEQKTADIQGRIDGHLSSNTSKSYTSENLVAMRLCLQRFVPELSAQFDGACAERSPGLHVLDDLFDRYFLSCVQ